GARHTRAQRDHGGKDRGATNPVHQRGIILYLATRMADHLATRMAINYFEIRYLWHFCVISLLLLCQAMLLLNSAYFFFIRE
ncbi:hypothetical protein CEUSTIGMA_g2167.t1, partial [Chlamydomonas eustigma]